MKKFFNDLGWKLQRFMAGRYGIDRLWRFLFIVYFIILIIANIVFRFSKLSYYALFVMANALMIFAIFRVFSKNIDARRSENESYLRFVGKIKQRNKLIKDRWQQRKTHKFVKCKKCKRVLRVPKHRGKINVTCPHCKNQFVISTGKKAQ